MRGSLAKASIVFVVGLVLGAVAVRSGLYDHLRASFDGSAAAAVSPSPARTPSPAFWEQPDALAGPDAAHSRFAQLAEAAAPGVVNVHTSKTVHQQIGGDSLLPFLFRDLFEAPLARDPRSRLPSRDFSVSSLGTGFVISAEGDIVTNNHVVDGVDEITIHLDTMNGHWNTQHASVSDGSRAHPAAGAGRPGKRGLTTLPSRALPRKLRT